MNIAVVNASVAVGKSQPSQKVSNEQQDEFNKTFSSLLNKSSMESSNEQTNDEKESTEMMDDLASLMIQLPLLNLTPLSTDMTNQEVLVQKANLELETGQSLMQGLNLFQPSPSTSAVEGESIKNSPLLETLENSVSSEKLDYELLEESLNTKPFDDYSSTTSQSQRNSKLQNDEHQLSTAHLQQQDIELSSMLPDEAINLDKSLSFKDNLEKQSTLVTEQYNPLFKDSLEKQSIRVIEQDNPLLNDSSNKQSIQFTNQEKNLLQSTLGQEETLDVDSFEGEIKSVQESIAINHGTMTFKSDVTVHEANSKPVFNSNYLKWDNQSEIMESLRHQISILKENDYTTLQLKLYPQHLGSISVELKMKNGVLNAHVLVEQSELKAVIEQEFHQINLDGIAIEQLNVEVNAQRHQQSKSETPTKASKSFTLEDEPVEEVEVIQKEIQHTGYLNLTV